jgi:hypothetical protein
MPLPARQRRRTWITVAPPGKARGAGTATVKRCGRAADPAPRFRQAVTETIDLDAGRALPMRDRGRRTPLWPLRCPPSLAAAAAPCCCGAVPLIAAAGGTVNPPSTRALP